MDSQVWNVGRPRFAPIVPALRGDQKEIQHFVSTRVDSKSHLRLRPLKTASSEAFKEHGGGMAAPGTGFIVWIRPK